MTNLPHKILNSPAYVFVFPITSPPPKLVDLTCLFQQPTNHLHIIIIFFLSYVDVLRFDKHVYINSTQIQSLQTFSTTCIYILRKHNLSIDQNKCIRCIYFLSLLLQKKRIHRGIWPPVQSVYDYLHHKLKEGGEGARERTLQNVKVRANYSSIGWHCTDL